MTKPSKAAIATAAKEFMDLPYSERLAVFAESMREDGSPLRVMFLTPLLLSTARNLLVRNENLSKDVKTLNDELLSSREENRSLGERNDSIRFRFRVLAFLSAVYVVASATALAGVFK